MEEVNKLPNSPFTKLTWGFIYLLRMGDKYKIGRAINLRTRIKAINDYLKRNGKEMVTVEHYFIAVDCGKTEHQLHTRFADKRIESETAPRHSYSWRNDWARLSEWYRLAGDDIQYIKALTDEI